MNFGVFHICHSFIFWFDSCFYIYSCHPFDLVLVNCEFLLGCLNCSHETPVKVACNKCSWSLLSWAYGSGKWMTTPCVLFNPILIRVYLVRKWGWPDLPHRASNLSNSHSPPCSIHGIHFLQANTLALLIH